ncbi:MoaD/ThiS family protein [Natronomonas sp. EA1]|uniref:MoaD/ThiS family protein n=1 Tax=Natronomonas sp. EA1 TaxID=3421655 RepID=UPI003EBA8AD9
MHVTVELYGTLRDAVGHKSLSRNAPQGATAGEVVHELGEEYGSLGPLVFDSEGRVRPHIGIVVNDEPAERDTVLAAGDTLLLAPAVAGGVSLR